MREIKYSQEFWLGRREQGDYTDEEYIKIQSERLKELESAVCEYIRTVDLVESNLSTHYMSWPTLKSYKVIFEKLLDNT